MDKINSKLLAFLVFIIVLLAISSNTKFWSLLVFLHLTIILISAFSIYSKIQEPFSFYKIYHIFNLFFFGIAPILQFYENSKFVGEKLLSYDARLNASLIILVATIFFNFFYSFFKRKIIRQSNIPFSNLTLPTNYSGKKSIRISLILLFVSTLSFTIVLYINNFSIVSLLFRSGEFSNRIELNKISFLLIEKFIKPMALISFIIGFIVLKKKWFVKILLFTLLLLTAFPLGMGRNAAAGFYLPLLLLFMPLFRRPNFFANSFIFGLLIIFPFLDNFRHFTGELKIGFGLNFKMFTALHFDAYASLARIMEAQIVTYGNQLLGVLFFFVPSSIWTSKPLSSGIYQAEVLNLSFDNLSCPLLAEGYINFGYLGIFLFLFFLTYFSARMDKIYWSSLNGTSNFFNVIYVILLGMFLFILRGDLMSGFAYTTGMIFTALFLHKLMKRVY